jgi:probable F420-dependent oxidoreductase
MWVVYGPGMKFGVMFANVGPFTQPDAAAGFGRAAEEAGFESIWTVEHVVVPKGYESAYPYSRSGKMQAPDDIDLPDPLIWLTWVAAATTTLRLGTGILILPQRNPAITAKQVATLDVLSGGRVELGVGVGWLEEEFKVLGVPFEQRGRRTDEHIEAMRALWTQEQSSYHGQFVSFDDAISRPRPAQGSVPITIGGHTGAAARRAGRLGDGFFPGRGSHEDLAGLLGEMRAAAADHGRDADAIEITSGGRGVMGPEAIEEIKALEDLGVDRVVIPPLAFDVDGLREALGRFGDEVISKAG